MSTSSAFGGTSEFDRDAVFEAGPSGPATQDWRAFVTRTLGLGETVTADRALMAWTTDLLRREFPERQTGVMTWLQWVAPVGAAGWTVPDDPPGTPDHLVLSVTDGRLVSAKGSPGLFDIQTGAFEPLAANERLSGWFKVEVYNLSELFRLCSARAEAWTSKQQKSGRTPTPTPPAS